MNTIPSPETLRPLLEAALAVMEPNDPAREELSASIKLKGIQKSYVVSFYFYAQNPTRDCFGHGETPEAALENFKAKYTPPPTVKNRIAELRAELAKLEGSK